MEKSPTAVKYFKFEDFIDENSSEDRVTLTVLIPEVVSEGYGMYTWPCASVLAQYVWYNRKSFKDATLLEIGAGTALPGVVAAKCGAKVTLSDSLQLPECLRLCRESCKINDLSSSVDVVGLTWGQLIPDSLRSQNFDIILGSDCFYTPSNFEDILYTVSLLLEHNSDSRFVFAYQERVSDWTIEHLIIKWSLKCQIIPLEKFDAHHPNIAGSTLPGIHKVNVFQITLA